MATPHGTEDLLYVQRGPASLTEMSGQEVQEALKRTKVILIPVGRRRIMVRICRWGPTAWRAARSAGAPRSVWRR